MANRATPEEIHTFVQERLSDYIDGALSVGEIARIDKHLKECERCSTSLATLRWTVELLKEAPTPALPKSFTLPVPVAEPRAAFRWLNFGLGASAVAAALALLVFGASLFSNSGRLSAPPAAGSLAGPTTVALASAPPPAPAAAVDQAGNPSPTEPATSENSRAPSAVTSLPAATNAPLSSAPASGALVSPSTTPTSAAKAASATTASPGGDCARCTASPTQAAPAQPPMRGQVISDTLALRSGPDNASPQVGQLKRGEIVSVVGRAANGEWYALRQPTIANPNGIAWALARGLRVAQPLLLPTIVVPTATPTPP